MLYTCPPSHTNALIAAPHPTQTHSLLPSIPHKRTHCCPPSHTNALIAADVRARLCVRDGAHEDRESTHHSLGGNLQTTHGNTAWCVRVCKCVCVFVSVCVCLWVCVCACVFKRLKSVCAYACAYVCGHVFECVCVFMRVRGGLHVFLCLHFIYNHPATPPPDYYLFTLFTIYNAVWLLCVPLCWLPDLDYLRLPHRAHWRGGRSVFAWLGVFAVTAKPSVCTGNVALPTGCVITTSAPPFFSATGKHSLLGYPSSPIIAQVFWYFGAHSALYSPCRLHH